MATAEENSDFEITIKVTSDGDTVTTPLRVEAGDSIPKSIEIPYKVGDQIDLGVAYDDGNGSAQNYAIALSAAGSLVASNLRVNGHDDGSVIYSNQGGTPAPPSL